MRARDRASRRGRRPSARACRRAPARGLGLTVLFASYVREPIEAGELVTVLEEYCEPFPGFFLYFPRRRHRRAALQALIDFAREHVRVGPGG
ncbi:MAG: LysR substrate-binding domain-containing protein [Gemmatimonadales bacterium]